MSKKIKCVEARISWGVDDFEVNWKKEHDGAKVNGEVLIINIDELTKAQASEAIKKIRSKIQEDE